MQEMVLKIFEYYCFGLSKMELYDEAELNLNLFFSHFMQKCVIFMVRCNAL